MTHKDQLDARSRQYLEASSRMPPIAGGNYHLDLQEGDHAVSMSLETFVRIGEAIAAGADKRWYTEDKAEDGPGYILDDGDVLASAGLNAWQGGKTYPQDTAIPLLLDKVANLCEHGYPICAPCDHVPTSWKMVP